MLLKPSSGLLQVRVDLEVLETIDVPWGGLEDGWLLVGERATDYVLITHAISHGPKSVQTPSSIEFDREDLNRRLLSLRESTGRALVPVGIAHTHPPRCNMPSTADFMADYEWVQGSEEAWVFCIVCGGLTWWLLKAGWHNYEELK